MSFPALIYTIAAVAFFILMINRPAVEPPNANMQPPASAVETASAGTTLNITAIGATDSSGADDNITAGDTTTDSSKGDTSSGDGSTASTQADGTQSASSEVVASNSAADAANQAATDDAANTSAQSSAAQTDSATNTRQTASSTQPDYARERRISNEIRDAVLEGDIFYLNDGSRSFMSIQTNANERRGGALILHGRGLHPDWEDTVYPLRTGLAEQGWTTLSLQLPVLEKGAKYYDYVPLFAEAGKRIQAGIRHLKQQGISPITLVAHSCGAHMAMQWVRDYGDADIAAYVGLGMGATDLGQTMADPLPLDKMQVPVFDVYGENDFPAVLKMAPLRWNQITTAGNPASAQRMLPDADHDFKDKDDALVGAVSTWLNALQL